jgi:hypothetical protein
MIVSYPESYIVPVIMEDDFDVNMSEGRGDEAEGTNTFLGYGESREELTSPIYL